MAKAFDMSFPTASITLGDDRTGSIAGSATNITGQAVKMRFSVQAEAPAEATWATIEAVPGTVAPAPGAAVERDVALGGTEKFVVRFAVPLDKPATTFMFKAYAEVTTNTDELWDDLPLSVTTKEREVTPGPPKWLVPVAILGVILLAALIVFGIKALTGDDKRRVAVPDVIGQQWLLGGAELVNAGFKVEAVEKKVASKAQEGVVLEQDPAGGEADEGSTITLTVGSFTPSGGGGGKTTLDFDDFKTIVEQPVLSDKFTGIPVGTTVPGFRTEMDRRIDQG